MFIKIRYKLISEVSHSVADWFSFLQFLGSKIRMYGEVLPERSTNGLKKAYFALERKKKNLSRKNPSFLCELL